MYKNPQLSTQAKRLRAELSKCSVAITHAQALEVVARIAGARTLHVEHAKNNAGVPIADVAQKQASDLMFESLGRFDGNVPGLLASIRAAFDLSDIGSRHVEQAVHELFETDIAPKVSSMFGSFKLEDLPDAHAALVTRLTATLEHAADATAQASGTVVNQALVTALEEIVAGVGSDWNTETREGTRMFEKAVQAIAQARNKPAVPPELQPDTGDSVYECKVYDWRVAEAHDLASLPVHHRQEFELKVTRNRFQLFVDMAPAGRTLEQLCDDGMPQMSLFIEVNEGRPCVHMTNTLYGDQVLTVFFTEGGLYLRPESSDLSIRTGIPRQSTLAQLQEELAAPFVVKSQSEAFIEAPNRSN